MHCCCRTFLYSMKLEIQLLNTAGLLFIPYFTNFIIIFVREIWQKWMNELWTKFPLPKENTYNYFRQEKEVGIPRSAFGSFQKWSNNVRCGYQRRSRHLHVWGELVGQCNEKCTYVFKTYDFIFITYHNCTIQRFTSGHNFQCSRIQTRWQVADKPVSINYCSILKPFASSHCFHNSAFA